MIKYCLDAASVEKFGFDLYYMIFLLAFYGALVNAFSNWIHFMTLSTVGFRKVGIACFLPINWIIID